MFWRLTVEVLDQVHRVAPRSHLGPLLASGLVLAPLCALVSYRVSRSPSASAFGALAGSTLAVAVSLTLFRVGDRPGSLAGLRACVVTDPVLLSGDGLANFLLFVPTAFLGVLAVGGPGRVAAAVTAISLAVEALQGIRFVGVCDSSDALLNALGGLAAAVVAAGVRRAFTPLCSPGRGNVPGSGLCRGSC